MAICKICKNEKEMYRTSKPGNWSYGVCLDCGRAEYARQKLRVHRERATGTESTTDTIKCAKCGESRLLNCYPPSSAASASIGFMATCRPCGAARSREVYKLRKAARLAEKQKAAEIASYSDLDSSEDLADIL
jgi:hypothetical protein